MIANPEKNCNILLDNLDKDSKERSAMKLKKTYWKYQKWILKAT